MLQSNKRPFLIPVEALKPRLQPQLPLLGPPLSNLLRLTVTIFVSLSGPLACFSMLILAQLISRTWAF